MTTTVTMFDNLLGIVWNRRPWPDAISLSLKDTKNGGAKKKLHGNAANGTARMPIDFTTSIYFVQVNDSINLSSISLMGCH